MTYEIRFGDEADEHVVGLTAHQRTRLFDAIERQLVHEPTKQTRNRKPQRVDEPLYIAPWELRIGEMRVYYSVEEGARPRVVIEAVGIKERSRLLIGGREVAS